MLNFTGFPTNATSISTFGANSLAISGLVTLSDTTPIAGGSVTATKDSITTYASIGNDGRYTLIVPTSGTYTVMIHPELAYSIGPSEPNSYSLSVTGPVTQNFVVQAALWADDFQDYTTTANMETGMVAKMLPGADPSYINSVTLDGAGGNTEGPLSMKYDWPSRPQGALATRQYCKILDPLDPDYDPAYNGQVEYTVGCQNRFNPPPLIGGAGSNLYFRFSTKESANFTPGEDVCLPIAGISYKFFLANIGPGDPNPRLGVYLTKTTNDNVLPPAIYMDLVDRSGGVTNSNGYALGNSFLGSYHSYVVEMLNLGTSSCTVNLYIDGATTPACTLTGPCLAPGGNTYGGAGQSWPIEMGANINMGPAVAQSRWWREIAMYRTRPSLLRIADPDAQLIGVSIVATTPDASEDGPENGVFTFTRTGDTSAALTVNYSISGTATNGTDYTTIGTSVVIASGDTTAIVTIEPIPDAAVEGSETVILTVTSGSYIISTPATATVTIVDPPPPSIPFAVVQSATIGSAPITLPSTAAGNALILAVYGGATGNPTITDSSGNTWARIQGENFQFGISLFIAYNIVASPSTLTVSGTGLGGFYAFSIFEAEGLNTVSLPVRAGAVINRGASGTSASPGAVGCTIGDIIIGFNAFSAGTTTAAAGYTAIENPFYVLAYKVAASTTETPSATGDTSSSWEAIGCALIPS